MGGGKIELLSSMAGVAETPAGEFNSIMPNLIGAVIEIPHDNISF